MRQSGARFWKPETDYELKDERNLWTGESEGIQHLVFVTWWKAGKLKKTFVQHSANSKGKGEQRVPETPSSGFPASHSRDNSYKVVLRQ